MDNNRYINLKTFEVTDHIPNYIVADKDIANTIAILNKKGYKTIASCSGHFYVPTMHMQQNVDIDFLEEAKNDPLDIILNVREKDFDLWSESRITVLYIMFDKNYKFLNLPDGFIECGNSINCTIEFFENNKRKCEEKILNEIEKYNKILEDWACNLPDIN